MAREENAVAYVPHILRSMKEICVAFGVGQKTVRAWVQQGAPIAVEGQGRRARYSAEVARLQCWREGCEKAVNPSPDMPLICS